MDPDWLTRRYAPVVVEANEGKPYGGYATLYTGPGTGNTAMVQAFWTVAHLGMRHNVYFSSTNPAHTRVHLRDSGPDEGVILCVYYGQPNRVVVYVDGKLYRPLAEPTWDNRKLPKLDLSMPSGANVYDRIGVGPDKRPGYLYVVVKGPQPVDLVFTKKIKLTKKLEVGASEFVHQKGTQGLVRNIALLLNIPESRIQIAGRGKMKDGHIWNEKNGVANGYKPSAKETPPHLESSQNLSLLEMFGDDPELDVVIDAVAPPTLDNMYQKEQELVSLHRSAVKACRKKSTGCAEEPKVDEVGVPGWTCAIKSYDGGDGCDCDCGIWDPDCDAQSVWAYGVAKEDGEIDLVDTARMEKLIKDFDNSPFNHHLETHELHKMNSSLPLRNPLRVLAHQVSAAGKNFMPLLKQASSSKCVQGKVCIKNRRRPFAKTGKAAGECVSMAAVAPGSACQAKPCGNEAAVCTSSTENSWDYTCSPAVTNEAVISIVNVLSGKCLGYTGGKIHGEDCGQASKAWQLKPQDGSFMIKSKASNKCISYDNGIGVQDCSSSEALLWDITMDDVATTLQSKKAKECLQFDPVTDRLFVHQCIRHYGPQGWDLVGASM
eukprot:gnl/MRDRNA2_/MRDRNA2_25620_c0_seq1.p1 gnl/MRDRNA2_/MRDRNA2_25620_c0~~gnl/MRDRNA2_/MRDRNA2_25620_c0_seq1.p1  ORF type:complete len:615 (+),score=98.93 gnl/MRDRNA2_/MRDRNA2_25620_c0_seq1:41-1846(+)